MTREEIKQLEKMANYLDSRFHIPGTPIRFGLDSLLGIIPGIGDTVTLASTVYLLLKAHHYNLPLMIKVKMVWNSFIDWLVGLIPLVGDIFDVGWKSNQKNVALIKNHFEKHQKDSTPKTA